MFNFVSISKIKPPVEVDVIFKLSDGTYAVGFRNNYNEYVPSSVNYTYDEGTVGFDSTPIMWDFLPEE